MTDQDFPDRAQNLDKERAALTEELSTLKQAPSGGASYIFLNIGIIFILLSLVHTDYILASVGVTLTFFGGFFLFIKPYQFIRKDIFDASFLESIENLNAILKSENYLEKPHYTSSGTLKDIEEVNLFFQKNINLDTTDDFQDVSSERNNRLNITPSGVKLSKLIEKELNKSFLAIDLNYLVENLESVIVEKLEFVKSFSMNVETNNIYMKLEKTVFDNFFSNTENISDGIYEVDPLTSALACILAITSQKTVYIDKIEWNPVNKIESIIYTLV